MIHIVDAFKFGKNRISLKSRKKTPENTNTNTDSYTKNKINTNINTNPNTYALINTQSLQIKIRVLALFIGIETLPKKWYLSFSKLIQINFNNVKTFLRHLKLMS